VPGLLIACGGRGGEVFPQLADVRREIHDVKYDVLSDISQGVADVAVRCERSEPGPRERSGVS
jgi:hypothetical protein